MIITEDIKKKVIDLYFNRDIKMKNIASEIGCSQGSVSNIVKSIKTRSDRYSVNLARFGKTNGGGKKLEEYQVIEIFNSSKSNKELGHIYGVTNTMCRRIKNRQVWKWLLNDIK